MRIAALIGICGGVMLMTGWNNFLGSSIVIAAGILASFR
jgi:hypothetical protein